jgi:hypothetical protein
MPRRSSLCPFKKLITGRKSPSRALLHPVRMRTWAHQPAAEFGKCASFQHVQFWHMTRIQDYVLRYDRSRGRCGLDWFIREIDLFTSSFRMMRAKAVATTVDAVLCFGDQATKFALMSGPVQLPEMNCCKSCAAIQSVARPSASFATTSRYRSPSKNAQVDGPRGRVTRGR